MKDVSDGIDRFKRLPGVRMNAKDVFEELALAAAAARKRVDDVATLGA